MKTIDDLLLCLYFDRSSDLFFEGLHPSGWTLAQHTTKTILRLAGLGHAILVGRGANVITARLPNVFHVRLVALLLTRNRHAAEFYHLSEAEAAKLVREQDHARRRYVRRYFNSEIDDRDPLRRDAQHRSFGFCRRGRDHRAAGVAEPPRFCRTRTLMAHSHTGRRCCTNLACTLKSAYPFHWEMTKRFELAAFAAGGDLLDGASMTKTSSSS